MSNSLNISPVDFGKSSDKLFLDDPEVWVKILDDDSWTDFKPLGYAEIEKSFSIEKEYAEFRTGIPEQLISKKVVSVKRYFSCKLKQLQPETLALLQEGIIESGTGENYVHLGSESPATVNLAIIVKGKTEDGKNLELRIRKSVMVTESIEMALGSKEYASMDFKVEVVVDDDPLASLFSWRAYGEVSAVAALTSSSADITVDDATGLEVGMYAYGSGIPSGAVISEIDGTTITLSASAESTATDVAVKFITAENKLKTDVAYWIVAA